MLRCQDIVAVHVSFSRRFTGLESAAEINRWQYATAEDRYLTEVRLPARPDAGC